jgi:hypothetical protein
MRKRESANQRPRLMRTNTSGYRGVSWHKGAGKWHARIKLNGSVQYLGLFDTAEEASAAYVRAAGDLDGEFDPVVERDNLLSSVRSLCETHGLKALSTPFLEKQRDALYPRLLAAGLKQKELLHALNLTEEYATWRDANRSYRGVTKPKWSWDSAVARAKEIKAQEGDLPTVEECRLRGLSGMIAAVHRSGRTWDDLRRAVGCEPAQGFRESRNGMRWRSRPEACLSNFLYARGVKHERGKRYPDGYAVQSGRHWATYDLHFQTRDGRWIDVEVWGEDRGAISRGRYRQTRKQKETWQANRSDFLGIPYLDCLSDESLE